MQRKNLCTNEKKKTNMDRLQSESGKWMFEVCLFLSLVVVGVEHSILVFLVVHSVSAVATAAAIFVIVVVVD